VLFVAFTFSTQPSAQADTFGSGGNIFAIQFGAVGNTGNLPDTTGYGAVPYEYRIGLYEISGDQVAAAVQLGLSNVNAIGGGGPAVSISWLQSAAFVNWLNTSSGYQVAYNLNYSGGWNIDPWSPSEAWQLGGQNLFRNKNAYYFLPSESEWYKAAYHTFYMDELYLFITKKILFNVVGRPAAWFDKNVVDGMVNATGNTTQAISEKIKGFQSGKVQDYAIYFLAGAIALAVCGIYIWM
jgi:formylglycine-generating enzyme required for sulfatase activity